MSFISIVGLYITTCVVCLVFVCIIERIYNRAKTNKELKNSSEQCGREPYQKVISEYLLDLRKRNKTLPARHLDSLYDMYDDIAGGYSEARARNAIKDVMSYEIDKKS